MNQNNQLTDNEKSQILQFFRKNGIKKITVDDGKLIIEYGSNKYHNRF